jgi:hypothetical protein
MMSGSLVPRASHVQWCVSTAVHQIHVSRIQFQQFRKHFGLAVGCSVVYCERIVQGHHRLLQQQADKVDIVGIQGLEDVSDPLLMLRVQNGVPWSFIMECAPPPDFLDLLVCVVWKLLLEVPTIEGGDRNPLDALVEQVWSPQVEAT